MRSRLLVSAGFTTLLAAAVFAGVYWMGVLTGRGQRVENRALESSTYASQWRGLLDLVTVPDLAIALIGVLLIALVQRDLRNVLRAFLAIGIANVAAQALKHELLVRPDLAALDARNTFPSGHAVAFASVLFVLVIVVPPRVRTATAVIASIIVSVVAFQLLGFGWHRLSDVIGGVMIVLAAVGFVHLVVPPRRTDVRWRPPSAFTVFAIGLVIVLAVVAAGLLVVAAVVRGDAEPALLLLATQLAAIASVVLSAWLVCRVAPVRVRAPRGSKYDGRDDTGRTMPVAWQHDVRGTAG